LHIGAYHSQINNRKEKEKQRIKISENSTRTTGKPKGKMVILFKERKMKRLHIINTMDSRKNRRFKMQVRPKLNEKEQIINASHVSTSTHHASLDSHLIRRQQAVHDGQLGLQLSDLTVQATNGSKHSVLLVPVVQEQIVASEIGDVSLKEFKASLQISFLMFKPHPLKQRLLVLFKVLTSTKPPVINC
jgi:hypothetical protein